MTAMFNPLHSKMNQGLYEKHLCNQSSYNEKLQMVPPAPVKGAAPINYYRKVKYPLCFFVYNFQLVMQQYESRPTQKAPL